MAEEKKPNPAKEFLGKHGEKLGLGAAALALVLYLVFGIAMAKEDTSARDLRNVTDRLDGEMKKRHDIYTAPEVKIDSSSALGAWNTVTTAKPGGDAVARALPEFAISMISKPKEVQRAVKVPSIAFGTTAVDFDGVTITWSATEFTKQEIAKEKLTDFLKLTGFLIERETNGSGKWEKVAEVDAKTTTYKDNNINPKTKYAYRITSVPDPDPKKRDGAKGMTVSTPSPVRTLAIWKLSFTQPSKPAGAVQGSV